MEDSNLVKARSTIVWLLALLIAFGAVWWIERETGQELIAHESGAATAPSIPPSADLPATPTPRALTAQERAWARTAWSYFETQTDPRTGLVASVAGFPSTTLWDTGSYLLALIAAHDLGLIDAAAFDSRLDRALASLERLPLHDRALPNKSYDIRSLAMTDYRNQPSEAGIGWSALDVGRLLVPLNIIVWQHPRHTEAVRAVLARWKLPRLAHEGELWGVHLRDGEAPQPLQEGRLGYEQYAAHALALRGLDVGLAANWLHQLRWVNVEGVQVPADRRDARQFGALDAVLSEPFVLQGLELGWDWQARELAWHVLRAQELRYAHTGILTAVSEDHVDQAPWFVYNAVYANGQPWTAVTDAGQAVPGLRTLSVKAAFGWYALYRTPYTTRLIEAVAPLQQTAKGWWAGRYEKDHRPNKALTANTNAVVLESLAYIQGGRLMDFR